jgi:hypothetical protein
LNLFESSKKFALEYSIKDGGRGLIIWSMNLLTFI